MGIKVISFDLDNCLSDKNFDELVWRTEIPRLYSEQNGISLNESYDFITSEYARLKGKTELWRDVGFWFSHFRLRKGWKKVCSGLKSRIKHYPDVIPVLKELKKHYKIIIISHAERNFLDLKLSVNNLKKFIDASFSVRAELGNYHKSEKIFLLVCKKMGIKPSELVHIGDDLFYDYKIPKSAGIRSFLIDRTGKRKGRHIVKSMFEFRKRII